MKKKCFAIGLMVLLASEVPLAAATLADVTKADPAYSSIQESVDQGYLSLYQGNKFLPDQSITRRELATAIDKLNDKLNSRQLSFTQSELQELQTVAKNFKAYLTSHDETLQSLQQRITDLENTQRLSNLEWVTMRNTLTETTAQLKTATLWQWGILGGGIILSAILATGR